jgi:ribosomal protein L29
MFCLQEELENKLDAVERELGSLRMTLKRYNVLKTAG